MKPKPPINQQASGQGVSSCPACNALAFTRQDPGGLHLVYCASTGCLILGPAADQKALLEKWNSLPRTGAPTDFAKTYAGIHDRFLAAMREIRDRLDRAVEVGG